jgi:CheY-like chemotaxis protein
MSYSRHIHVLIVEDDPNVKDHYEELFRAKRKADNRVLNLRFAFSYEEAIVELTSNRIFQLVVLDLCLPEKSSLPATEQVDLGLLVLKECQNRDAYPIPGLLIVTGYAAKADQSELRSRLKDSFAYGELVVKGGDLMPELERAIKEIFSYLDVGIHIRDSGDRRWPTLSPREEDLLRRAAVKVDVDGVDLAWWSAEYTRPTGTHAQFCGWTKTLMGYFLLGAGRGASRIDFFKFAPAAEADVVVQDARLLEQKLSHIKVVSHVVGGARMLLVTEKVGTSQKPPIPLDEYISKAMIGGSASLLTIVSDIVEQLRSLGTARFESRRLRDLLWSGGHDEKRISDARARYRSELTSNVLKELASDSVQLLREIRAGDVRVQFEEMDCVHGDLNVTNVAIDMIDGIARAFIFDASGSSRGAAVRDVAMLEVTALLHVPRDLQMSMVQECGVVLYRNHVIVPPRELELLETEGRIGNTIRLISLIRSKFADEAQLALYAFAVFDQALIQLGGLAWSTDNKVSRFDDAVLLAELAAGWFLRVAGARFLSQRVASSVSVAPAADAV